MDHYTELYKRVKSREGQHGHLAKGSFGRETCRSGAENKTISEDKSKTGDNLVTWTKSGINTLQNPKSLNVQSSRAERKRKSQQSQRASNQSLASALNFHYTRERFVTVEFLCGLRFFCFGSNGGPITWSCQLLDSG
jgi:hypothetical protein